MYIASQILVIIADILYVISMFAKDKKRLLLYLILSDVFFGVHYFLLKAFTGGYILFVDIAFLILTYIFNEKKNNKAIVLTSLVSAVLSIIIGVLTWAGAISLLPMIGMSIYFVGFCVDELVVNKVSCSIRNLCNIIYMLILASYVGASLEFVLMLSAIVGSIINFKHKQTVQAKAVTEKTETTSDTKGIENDQTEQTGDEQNN
mgnify:FL=1